MTKILSEVGSHVTFETDKMAKVALYNYTHAARLLISDYLPLSINKLQKERETKEKKKKKKEIFLFSTERCHLPLRMFMYTHS